MKSTFMHDKFQNLVIILQEGTFHTQVLFTLSSCIRNGHIRLGRRPHQNGQQTYRRACIKPFAVRGGARRVKPHVYKRTSRIDSRSVHA